MGGVCVRGFVRYRLKLAGNARLTVFFAYGKDRVTIALFASSKELNSEDYSMSDRHLPAAATDPFTRLDLGRAKLRSKEMSAVTSAWGVDWSEELIARDLMQNFFDANRKQLDKIVVTAQRNHVSVAAPASFDLHHLFFLGSEKGDDDVGQYGEGFKAAAVCILRRQGTLLLAASGKIGVIIRLADEAVVGTHLTHSFTSFSIWMSPHPAASWSLRAPGPPCVERLSKD
jgi:hypothetical protein